MTKQTTIVVTGALRVKGLKPKCKPIYMYVSFHDYWEENKKWDGSCQWNHFHHINFIKYYLGQINGIFGRKIKYTVA